MTYPASRNKARTGMPLIPPARGTALVRTISRLAIAKKLVSDQRASNIALEPRPQKSTAGCPVCAPLQDYYRIISGRTLRGNKSFLRDVDLSELPHLLLALLLQKLAFARDVAAIAFGGDVLAQRVRFRGRSPCRRSRPGSGSGTCAAESVPSSSRPSRGRGPRYGCDVVEPPRLTRTFDGLDGTACLICSSADDWSSTLWASTRNSTRARWASRSSTGRSCRHCSVRGKTRDCRNSIGRHCTNSWGNSPAGPGQLPSHRKPERCCWAVDDSRAGSHSRANDGPVACERPRLASRPAATTRER